MYTVVVSCPLIIHIGRPYYCYNQYVLKIQGVEVRLFDKGEMNTYRDNLNFSKTIYRVATESITSSISAEVTGAIEKQLAHLVTTMETYLHNDVELITAESPFIAKTQQKYHDYVRFLGSQLLAIRLLFDILRISMDQPTVELEKKVGSLFTKIKGKYVDLHINSALLSAMKGF